MAHLYGLVALLIVFLSLGAYGDDSVSYYINSMTGNNTNSGTTPAEPFLTIDAAIQAAEATSAHPIYYNLFPGTFNGTGNIDIKFNSNSVVQAYKEGGTTANSIINCEDSSSGNTAFTAHGDFTVNDIYFQNCFRHIWYSSNNGELEIRNSMFTTFQNIAVEIASGDTVMIDNCSFDGEKLSLSVENCTQVDIRNSDFYGAGMLLNDVGHGAMSECEFMNVIGEAESNSNTQAIKINNGVWELDIISVGSSGIDDGNSGEKGNGGALYFANGKLQLSNSTFELCHAGDLGGAVYVAGSEVVITDSHFMNNTTPDLGGGLYAVGCELSVDRSVFNGNQAMYGGAIDIAGNTTALLNDVKFEENMATDGSCVACCASDVTNCGATLEEANDIDSVNNVNTGANGVDITCKIVNQSSGTSTSGNQSEDNNTSGGMGTGWIVLIVLICVGVVVVTGLAIAGGIVFFVKKRGGYEEL